MSDSDNEFDLVDQDATSDGRVTINANVKKKIQLHFAQMRINRGRCFVVLADELEFVLNAV